MALSTSQIERFRQQGHLTVPEIFAATQMDRAAADLEQWSAEFRAQMTDQQRAWFLESEAPGEGTPPPIRKLDQPVACREVFAELAKSPELTACVEQLIGRGVSIFFSQVFLKPPEVGGPKPLHQDNFYFGPDDPDALLTAWIAIDEATEENGCLRYGEGSHLQGVVPHHAPPEEPFNLQVTDWQGETIAAPVPRGGVSFHHGSTLHQSSPNRSARPRRAVVFHYLRNDAQLVSPQLQYDLSLSLRVTEAPRHD